jgi:hypothetical protein
MLGTFRNILLVALLSGPVAIGACKVQQQIKTTVMHYEDFGPPSMVYELLGSDWWQWQPHGDSDPKKRYDIRVVVYRNIGLEEVRRKYPVKPEALQDYRYISYEDATRYLDRQIAENVLPTLTTRLRATRNDLGLKFASP